MMAPKKHHHSSTRSACNSHHNRWTIYNVVEVRYALSEHLNVALSTNTGRCALHEACLNQHRSGRSHFSRPRTCGACWNLLNVIKLFMVGIRWFLVTRLRSIEFDVMLALGVGWEMENHNYKFIMWVKQFKHVGGAIYVWGCMTSHVIWFMCKIEKKMTQALHLSILQDGVTKTIEWYRFSPSHVIFQRDNDPQHTFKFNHAVVVNAKCWYTYLASSTT